MNNKQRKRKKFAETELAQAAKGRRELVQEQILSKARPFIGTKIDIFSGETAESRVKQSSDGPKKPPKRQKQPKANIVKKRKVKTPTPQVKPEEQRKRALGYLKAWHSKAEGWKFAKKRQIWLVKNMYLRNEVSNEDFSIILEYLDTLTGPAREQVVSQAEDLFKECEAKMDKSGIEIPETCRVNYERARQVLQML